MERASLQRYARLSIGAAITTILLKTAAFLLTGSVGLLSDAAEPLEDRISFADTGSNHEHD